MAVATMSAETFLDLAKRSGAVDPRRLDGFLASRYPLGLPEPAALAEALVASGLMTRYQTEPLLAGKPQRFMLSGKYRVLDRLGAGGMASVFLCEHKIMRRRVAIKMLPPKLANNPSMLDRFHREARAIASVHHPNIVGAHDVDADGNVHFLVMEYVEGCNFHDLVRRSGQLPVDRAAHYIAQAAVGLHHAHEKGLVHRDIKPANLLIDRMGLVKILDLGLALVFSSEDDNLTKDHDANSILGTAEYLAPEQAIDSHGVDHRADLYSLGMTMYFLLAAATPYGEGTTAQKLIWHQLRSPKNIRDVRPDVPEELWAVLQKMLAKKVEDRYQSGREVVEALAPWTSAPIALPSDAEMPKQLVPLDSPTSEVGGYGPASDGGFAAPLTTPAFALPTPLDSLATGSSASRIPPASSRNGSGLAPAKPMSSAAPMPAVDLAPPAVDLAPPTVDLGPPPSAPRPPAPSPAPSAPSVPATPRRTPAPASATRPVPPPASPVDTSAGATAAPASAPSKGPKSAPAKENDPSSSGSSVVTVSAKGKKGGKKKEADAPKNNLPLLAGVGGGVVLLAVVSWLGGLFDSPQRPQPAPISQPAPVQPPKETKGPGVKTPPKENKGGKQQPPPPKQPTKPRVPDLPSLPDRAVAVTAGAKATTSSFSPERALDKDPATTWNVAGRKGWIQYELTGEFPVSHYRVGVGEGDPNNDPRDWELQGSADGKSWENLNGQSGIQFAERQLLKAFNVGNPKPYKFYRLDVTNNNSGDSLAVSEWDLFADPAAPMPMTPTVTEPTLTAEFFPVAPREVFYDVATNTAATPLAKPKWVMARRKWEFREPKTPEPKKDAKDDAPKHKVLGEAVVTVVQVTAPNAPLARPEWPAQANAARPVNQSLGTIQLREEDGLLQLVEIAANGAEGPAEPILKPGAKKGDTWVRKLPNGDNQTYLLEELEAGATGPKRATVKTSSAPVQVPALKATVVQITTVIYEQGVGEVKRTIEYEVTTATGKSQTALGFQRTKVD